MEYQNNNFDDNNNYNNYNYRPEGNPGLATGSMVCGILSIVLCCCYGIVGLILGIISIVLALKFKKDNNGILNGQALAVIICAIIGSILSLIMLVYTIYAITHYEEILNLYNWLINQQGGTK